MTTARDKTLLQGLIDWVDLARINWHVMLDNPAEAPLADLQDQVLSLIRSLVADGLFEVGDLTGAGGRFAAWDTSLDESVQRIHDMYVTRYDDKLYWQVGCWLSIADKGLAIAREIQAAEYPEEQSASHE